MHKIILTNANELHWWNYTQYYNHHKPCGLWYSVGMEWAIFVKNNLPEYNRTNNVIVLNVNSDKILLLETKEQCHDFYKKYKCKYDDLGHKEINWMEVSQDYSGIEIRNYNDLKPETPLRPKERGWLDGWDVSSGCIWDLSAVKNYSIGPFDIKSFNP